MMRLSAEIDETREKTAEQTRLLDSLTDSLRPQLNQLSAWAQNMPEEEQAFRASLKKAAVLLAYAKRRGNLLMQAAAHPVLSGEELRLCFEESARALRQADIPCSVTADTELLLSAENAAALYEAFEEILEQALPALEKVEIRLTRGSEKNVALTLTLCLDTDAMKQDAISALKRGLETAKREIDHGEVRLILIGKAQREGVIYDFD